MITMSLNSPKKKRTSYDSIQRGVSPGGVVLGATLTAAKGVVLIYLNKWIMYDATVIGSFFGPVGTAVGFVVGFAGAVAIYYLGELSDYEWSELKKALFE